MQRQGEAQGRLVLLLMEVLPAVPVMAAMRTLVLLCWCRWYWRWLTLLLAALYVSAAYCTSRLPAPLCT